MTKATILIVEDEFILALDMKRQLEEMGYEVVSYVSTGEEAVREAESRKPDLILMDVKIRGPMDGIEAAGRIQERMAVPLIYLTAYSDADVLSRAKRTRFFTYLVKPVNKRELSLNIEKALKKRKTEPGRAPNGNPPG